MLWWLVILQAVVCGFLASTVAELKGHNSGGWFLAGLLFSALGLLAAAGLPDIKTRQLIAELHQDKGGKQDISIPEHQR